MLVKSSSYCFNCVFTRRLNDGVLIELGVLDSNHRRAILNKASGAGGITDDFDNMLGDLDSVIKDLEMFSVVVSCLQYRRVWRNFFCSSW